MSRPLVDWGSGDLDEIRVLVPGVESLYYSDEEMVLLHPVAEAWSQEDGPWPRETVEAFVAHIRDQGWEVQVEHLPDWSVVDVYGLDQDVVLTDDLAQAAGYLDRQDAGASAQRGLLPGARRSAGRWRVPRWWAARAQKEPALQ